MKRSTSRPALPWRVDRALSVLMSARLPALVPALAWLCLLAAWGYASAQGRTTTTRTVTVEVLGEGDSAYAAQLDASRQALQRVLPQVVVADRQVQDDEVRERILSSVNGYIEAFKPLDERRTPSGQVQLRARVSVSTTSIETFLVMAAGPNRAEVSGAAVAAELAREKDNRAFRATFLRRLLNGYPRQAIAVELKRLYAVEGRPGVVQAEVSYALRPAFVEAFESGLRALACKADAPPGRCPAQVCVGRVPEAPREKSGLEKWLDAMAAQNRPAPTPREPMNCYRLPPGTDMSAPNCSDCVDSLYSYPVLRLLAGRDSAYGRLELMVNFLDSSGQRVVDAKSSQSSFDLGYAMDPPIRFDDDRLQGRLMISRQPTLAVLEIDLNAEGAVQRFAKVTRLAFHPVMVGYVDGPIRGRCAEVQALLPDGARDCWVDKP